MRKVDRKSEQGFQSDVFFLNGFWMYVLIFDGAIAYVLFSFLSMM